jgi:hypothetical protein
MTTATEFFNWWIIDQRTSERRLTTYKLTRIDAERAFRALSQTIQRARSATCPTEARSPEQQARIGVVVGIAVRRYVEGGVAKSGKSRRGREARYDITAFQPKSFLIAFLMGDP